MALKCTHLNVNHLLRLYHYTPTSPEREQFYNAVFWKGTSRTAG